VLALDAETGARRWSFQTTHLDIWDYDVAAQPVLTDFGGTPALVQATKRGEIFILDRRTGRPLTRVVERKTPASTVPGERAAPTQPFSIGFPSVAGPELTERMMWGITPLDQLLCRIAFRQSRYEGSMTPLDRDRFSIVYPGYAGGVNWGSVSIDTGRQIMLVSAMRLANRNRLLARAEVERQGIEVQMPGKPDLRGGPAPQVGTPYGAEIAAFLSPLGIPCQQPPFGTLTAIDMRSRKALWTIPLGTAERLGPLGVPSHIPVRIGTPLMGGAMTTAGGLTFVGATADRWLRAVDTRSGRILWRGRLPEAGQSVPISYVSQASGRQFVVVAAGGLLGSTGKSGDYLVAFALPRGGQ
jgi:quinoprotein glucose dehydrogenase